MKVSIVSKPGPDFISLAQKGNFDLILDSWYSADADVLYNTFDSSQSSGGGLNFTNYKSATLDGLLEKGRTTFNNKLATSYYAQAQRFILKNYLADAHAQALANLVKSTGAEYVVATATAMGHGDTSTPA